MEFKAQNNVQSDMRDSDIYIKNYAHINFYHSYTDPLCQGMSTPLTQRTLEYLASAMNIPASPNP